MTQGEDETWENKSGLGRKKRVEIRITYVFSIKTG